MRPVVYPCLCTRHLCYCTRDTIMKIFLGVNNLTANVKFDFFMDLNTEWVPRSFATHAFLCNTLFSNKLCTKTMKILKGLNSLAYKNDQTFGVLYIFMRY